MGNGQRFTILGDVHVGQQALGFKFLFQPFTRGWSMIQGFEVIGNHVGGNNRTFLLAY